MEVKILECIGSDLFAEPLTPPANSSQGIQRRNGDKQVSPNESKALGLLTKFKKN